MIRRLATLIAVLLLALPAALQADPADIDAAARGVVRVVIVENAGNDIVPIGHGTGFAVAPEYIVTNAHVVEEARSKPDLSIGIVPSDGGEAVYGRLVSVSPRNDLALIATTKAMNLPPLTISGNPPSDAGQVISVGYPMNVDRAQGLKISDLFRSQPPVKATGSLAGHRPSSRIRHPAAHRTDRPRQFGRSAARPVRPGNRRQQLRRGKRRGRCRILLRHIDPRTAAVPAGQQYHAADQRHPVPQPGRPRCRRTRHGQRRKRARPRPRHRQRKKRSRAAARMPAGRSISRSSTSAKTPWRWRSC